MSKYNIKEIFEDMIDNGNVFVDPAPPRKSPLERIIKILGNLVIKK